MKNLVTILALGLLATGTLVLTVFAEQNIYVLDAQGVPRLLDVHFLVYSLPVSLGIVLVTCAIAGILMMLVALLPVTSR